MVCDPHRMDSELSDFRGSLFERKMESEEPGGEKITAERKRALSGGQYG